MDNFFAPLLAHSLPAILPLLLAWGLDRLVGDPASFPHLIVGYGKLIAYWDARANRSGLSEVALRWRGCLMGIGLTLGCFLTSVLGLGALYYVSPLFPVLFSIPLIYYCLAGTTLAREVLQVFRSVDLSLDAGRVQVSRIVGRDTSQLSKQEVRIAALETLAENLNDGVIAPIFYYLTGALVGLLLWDGLRLSPLSIVVPATSLMLTYKMVNTLDSMVGYRNTKYVHFGRYSAIQDDVWGWLPARLTALLLLIVGNKLGRMAFVCKYGRAHLSPNSGYPEAAMAALLDCRFGGPHTYFGQEVYKPFIGEHDREVGTSDAEKAIRWNYRAEALCILLVILFLAVFSLVLLLFVA